MKWSILEYHTHPATTREEREQQRKLLSIQMEELRKPKKRLEQSNYEATKLKQERERELSIEFKKRCMNYPLRQRPGST